MIFGKKTKSLKNLKKLQANHSPKKTDSSKHQFENGLEASKPIGDDHDCETALSSDAAAHIDQIKQDSEEFKPSDNARNIATVVSFRRGS